MKYAVIDLGSNTFHLLIASYDGNGRINELFRERAFIGLSDGGIEIIKNTSYIRGLNCLEKFAHYLSKFHVSTVRVVGTAALRSASNRNEFIRDAQNILGFPIEVIDGKKEAWYIYRGITMIPETRRGNNIIIDIGGGSTEFIYIRDGDNIASESFKLGIGVLADRFHHKEPIGDDAINNIFNHVNNTLSSFLMGIDVRHINSLIGASGSFEILESMSGETAHYGYCNTISKKKFHIVYRKVINSNLEERLKINGLPEERAKLSPVGLILMKTAIDIFNPKQILVSTYAMKEGIMRDMTEVE